MLIRILLANGSSYDHGTMLYHAPGRVNLRKAQDKFIRTEYKQQDHGFNGSMMQANDMSVNEILDEIRRTVADKPVYVTFDIDC